MKRAEGIGSEGRSKIKIKTKSKGKGRSSLPHEGRDSKPLRAGAARARVAVPALKME
jgi:hypothetical protein